MNVLLSTAQRRAQVELIIRPSDDELPYAIAVGNLDAAGHNLGCARIYLFNRMAHQPYELLQTAEYIGEEMPATLGNALATLSKKKKVSCIAVLDNLEMNKGYRTFNFQKLFMRRLLDIPFFLHFPFCLTFSTQAICGEPDSRQVKELIQHFHKLNYIIESGGEQTYLSKVINPPAWYR